MDSPVSVLQKSEGDRSQRCGFTPLRQRRYAGPKLPAEKLAARFDLKSGNIAGATIIDSLMSLPEKIDRAKDAGLWAKGIVLAEAAVKFGPPKLVQELEKISDPNQIAKSLGGMSKPVPDDVPAALAILAAAVPVVKFLSDNSTIRTKIKDALIDGFIKGKFTAYGDFPPLNPKKAIQKIPGDYFRSAKINWNDSSLLIENLTILSIKVFRTNAIQRIWADRNKASIANQNSNGRPSRIPQIQLAISGLDSLGLLPPDGITKRFVQDIKDRVIAIDPPANHPGRKREWGLSNRVVRRQYSKYFQNWKSQLAP